MRRERRYRLVGAGECVKDIRHEFPAGEPVTIGRHHDNSVAIGRQAAGTSSGPVSRHHCLVEYRDGAWEVTDAGSMNGTAVVRPDGLRTEANRTPAALAPGDIIELAQCDAYDLMFEEFEVAGPANLDEARRTVVIGRQGAPSAQVVFQGRTVSTLALEAAGLTLTGENGAAPLPGIQGSAAAARIVWAQGSLFVEPAGGPAVAVNGAPGSNRRLLRDGDLLTFAGVPALTVIVLLPGQKPPRPLSEVMRGRKSAVLGAEDVSHPSVSRRHAEIRFDGAEWTARDVGSTNGTWVDGEALTEERALGEGWILSLGSVDFVVDLEAPRAKHGPSIVIRDAGWNTAAGPVLRKVSLVVAEREFVGVMGRSGSGKSTLLRLIAGKEKLSAGRISGPGVAKAREVGFVEQIDLAPEGLQLGEILTQAARLRGLAMATARERALEEARRVNLDGQWNRVVREPGGRLQLSGGQLKRMAVAKELIRDPKVLLLDEPTTGQDPANGEALMQLFRSLAQRGTTVLASTHDIHSIDLFHKVALLCLGRLVYFGPPGLLPTYFSKAAKEVFQELPDNFADGARAARMETAWRESPWFARYCGGDNV